MFGFEILNSRFLLTTPKGDGSLRLPANSLEAAGAESAASAPLLGSSKGGAGGLGSRDGPCNGDGGGLHSGDGDTRLVGSGGKYWGGEGGGLGSGDGHWDKAAEGLGSWDEQKCREGGELAPGDGQV